MSLVIGALVAANLSLYFAVISMTRFWRVSPWMTFLCMLLCCSACAFSCLLQKRRLLRFLPALLPFACLLLVRHTAEYACLVPALAYTQFVLLTGRFHISYWSYRLHYLWSSCVAILLLIIGLVARSSMRLAFPLMLLALLLGCFTLRQLRYGTQTTISQKALELGALLAVPGAAALLASLVGYGRTAAGWLLERVFYPLFWLLQKALEGFIAIFGKLEPPPEPLMPATEEPFVMPEEVLVPQETELVPNDPVPPDLSWLGRLLLILAVTALAAFLVWRICRYLRRRRPADREADDLLFTPEKGVAAPAMELPSNRRRVRRTYAKYLKLLQNRGYIRRSRDTSLDVLDATPDLAEPAAAEELRWVYLRARYSSKSISAQDVQEARRCLRLLRGQP